MLTTLKFVDPLFDEHVQLERRPRRDRCLVSLLDLLGNEHPIDYRHHHSPIFLLMGLPKVVQETGAPFRAYQNAA
jgi:hypothetical protein